MTDFASTSTRSVTQKQAARSPQRRVTVLDSFMSYRELGQGTPIVFLHGNPLSSYVWRNVMPELGNRGRCLAPDLIGMGDSGKPALEYRFADQSRYLDAWFESLGLGHVVLVGYDWGGALAMDWAARHPDHVRGIVVFETFLRPMSYTEWSPKGAELFRALRTPGVGEKMVLEANEFLERSLANGIRRRLDENERASYRAPYPDPASRRPLLQWTRSIPIDGEPADVQAIVTRYDTWLAASSTVPKLLLTFQPPPELQPSPTGSSAMATWARDHVAGLDVENLGYAGHHAPEDLPQEIGRAIGAWLDRRRIQNPT